MSAVVEIYDTSLRDGTQALGVNLSLADKLAITRKLDSLGVAYIEGGWPASNPKDQEYFLRVQELTLKHSKIAAFGSTRHFKNKPEEDPNLLALAECGADICCIFGKAWTLHVTEALRIGFDDNLQMIEDSVRFLAERTQKPVFFDAEHFFDGFFADRDYALSALAAALRGGASRLVLCDTNGGMLPKQIKEALETAQAHLPEAQFSIHVHNDGGLAIANTLQAVESGAIQVQGTMNGFGERCGNVDLIAVIANLELKFGKRCLPEGNLTGLTEVSHYVWERLNLQAPLNQPFVGKSAFAHKGGVHVSAMQRDKRTYEHIEPELVGNHRVILISELAGRSNILAKHQERFPELKDPALVSKIVEEIQDRENAGYSYETADASLDLLVRRHIGNQRPIFKLHYFRVHGLGTPDESHDAVEATLKVDVANETRLCAAEGNGPVDALNQVLRAALVPQFPILSRAQLTDYKVRVVNSADGTAARVRVLIEHDVAGERYITMGVHENVIEASWAALVEAMEYTIANESSFPSGDSVIPGKE